MELYLVNLDHRNQQIERLKIQSVPLEMRFEPIPEWKMVATLGRNNPFYHYTGAEDTLSFTLDWYSVDERREDVISSCKWVESLSKADGYRRGPARVLLIFGELFKNYTWIIESAPFDISLWNGASGMLPRQAYQELTLKRVTNKNLTRAEIRKW